MTEKDAYYFPHDSNAKDDPKCVLLIEQLGLEGYGIFWVLLETLRDQKDWKCPLSIIPALARRFNTSKEKMLAVINGYALFKVENDEFFFSEAFSRRMLVIDVRRRELSASGKLGNVIRWGSPPDRHPNRPPIAIKENKRKEKNIYNMASPIGEDGLTPKERLYEKLTGKKIHND